MAWLPGHIHDWSVMDGTGHIGQTRPDDRYYTALDGLVACMIGA
jgi:hypothetical protein